jgi:hypothetical protein
LEAGVGWVALGFYDGVGAIFPVVSKLRLEVFGDVRGYYCGEFGGVVVAAKDGCKYGL